MMRLGALTLTLTAVLFLAGCNNPAANKNQAVTGNAAPETPHTPSGQKFLITPENSKIEFTGSQVAGTHNGEFHKFSGEIDYTGNTETSHVTVTIDMDSLTADDPQLTAHLKTADFFDVAKNPQSKFVSTAIKSEGDKGGVHTITGNLTMHGVTRAVTFPAMILTKADAVDVNATFTINRKDFNINYAGPANNLIRDGVVLNLKIHATKN